MDPIAIFLIALGAFVAGNVFQWFVSKPAVQDWLGY